MMEDYSSIGLTPEEFLDVNVLGDKSLRSGVLIQRNGKIFNTKPPIVDPSFLSQLTTAHNGFLLLVLNLD